MRKRARKGVLRGPHLPSRVTPRPRKQASSLALDRVPTLASHEVRALERHPVPAVVSLAVAREPGRVRACYFPLISSTAIRARPADSRLGRRVASVDVRRARDEPDSSRDRRRRAESSRGPSRGSRGARVSTSRVCHGTPISLVGSSRAFPIGRSSGARARTRHRDARATLEDDDRLVAPRATRILRARALARLDEREQARRPSEFRSGSFVAVEISAGSVALGADFPEEKRGDAGFV